MKLTAPGVALIAAIAFGTHSMAQDHSGMAMSGQGGGMAMSSKTLLVAQLDAQQVVTGSSSKATGTGAFQLDPAKRTLDYRLTYQGLEGGPPLSIALYNFGKGKDGKLLAVLCGGARMACPVASSATISGQLNRNGIAGNGSLNITNPLITEFDAERVYVEILSADGSPEIRGQLAPNDAFTAIDNFVVALTPVGGSGSQASGTAVVSKTHLPDGKVDVTTIATVAGTSDTPRSLAVSVDRNQRGKDLTLPKLSARYSRDSKSGGSLLSHYVTDETAPEGLPNATASGSQTSPQNGLVVTSTQFPDGEVSGQLVPVE
jgi:hypothetical protein